MSITGCVKNVEITGITSVVPSKRVPNEIFLDRFDEEVIQKFEKMVGVKERRYATDGQTASDFAFIAAGRLKDAGKWSVETVDAIIFVSQSPDYVLPATACVLHHRLGLKKDCLAFDVNLGCSGFVYGVFLSSSLLQMPNVNRVLFLGGDCISRMVSPQDKSSAMLFGDGGFAVVMEKTARQVLLHYNMCTDGGGYKAIITPGLMLAGRHPYVYRGERKIRDTELDIKCHEYGEGVRRGAEDLYMDGMDVFNFTINEVPDLLKQTLADLGKTANMLSYLVLHQANKFILKQIAMATGFSMKQVPISLDRYGNTSVTSIPLTLCDLFGANEALEPLEVLMAGFGVGLSWGSIFTSIVPAVCLPVEETDQYFKQGEEPYV